MLLQEVIWCSARDHWLAGSRAGVELETKKRCQQHISLGGCKGDVQGVFEVLVDLHDGGLIAAAVAVIWSFRVC